MFDQTRNLDKSVLSHLLLPHSYPQLRKHSHDVSPTVLCKGAGYDLQRGSGRLECPLLDPFHLLQNQNQDQNQEAPRSNEQHKIDQYNAKGGDLGIERRERCIVTVPRSVPFLEDRQKGKAGRPDMPPTLVLVRRTPIGRKGRQIVTSRKADRPRLVSTPTGYIALPHLH